MNRIDMPSIDWFTGSLLSQTVAGLQPHTVEYQFGKDIMELAVYVAAPFVDQAVAKEARQKLLDAGYAVTSRWIDIEGEGGSFDPARESFYIENANHDVEDVYKCDVLVLLNTQKSEGKAVETGLAIAWFKPIIMVGERSNIFHYLNITRVPSVDDAIEVLKQWEEEYSRANETFAEPEAV